MAYDPNVEQSEREYQANRKGYRNGRIDTLKELIDALTKANEALYSSDLADVIEGLQQRLEATR